MTIFCTNQWLDNFFGSGRISNTRSNHSLFPFIWYSKHSTWRGLTNRLSSYSISNQSAIAESFQPLILDQSAGGINSGSYFGPIRWRNQLRILFWINQLGESSQPLFWTNQLAESSQPLFWTNQLAELSTESLTHFKKCGVGLRD